MLSNHVFKSKTFSFLYLIIITSCTIKAGQKKNNDKNYKTGAILNHSQLTSNESGNGDITNDNDSLSAQVKNKLERVTLDSFPSSIDENDEDIIGSTQSLTNDDELKVIEKAITEDIDPFKDNIKKLLDIEDAQYEDLNSVPSFKTIETFITDKNNEAEYERFFTYKVELKKSTKTLGFSSTKTKTMKTVINNLEEELKNNKSSNNKKTKRQQELAKAINIYESNRSMGVLRLSQEMEYSDFIDLSDKEKKEYQVRLDLIHIIESIQNEERFKYSDYSSAKSRKKIEKKLNELFKKAKKDSIENYLIFLFNEQMELVKGELRKLQDTKKNTKYKALHERLKEIFDISLDGKKYEDIEEVLLKFFKGDLIIEFIDTAIFMGFLKNSNVSNSYIYFSEEDIELKEYPFGKGWIGKVFQKLKSDYTPINTDVTSNVIQHPIEKQREFNIDVVDTSLKHIFENNNLISLTMDL